MLKHGRECVHCGITQTPAWRKGPPEKPTLCNACGSRWLVKQSLEGYMPLAHDERKRKGKGRHPLAASNSRNKKLKRRSSPTFHTASPLCLPYLLSNFVMAPTSGSVPTSSSNNEDEEMEEHAQLLLTATRGLTSSAEPHQPRYDRGEWGRDRCTLDSAISGGSSQDSDLSSDQGKIKGDATLATGTSVDSIRLQDNGSKPGTSATAAFSLPFPLFQSAWHSSPLFLAPFVNSPPSLLSTLAHLTPPPEIDLLYEEEGRIKQRISETTQALTALSQFNMLHNASTMVKEASRLLHLASSMVGQESPPASGQGRASQPATFQFVPLSPALSPASAPADDMPCCSKLEPISPSPSLAHLLGPKSDASRPAEVEQMQPSEGTYETIARLDLLRAVAGTGRKPRKQANPSASNH